MKDYPAAHSMDTQYFMIDECGHVVACFSNESGAIPHGAITGVLTKEEGDGEEAYWFEDERGALANVAPSHIGSLIKTFKGHHVDQRHAFFGQVYLLTKLPEEYKKPMEEGDPIKRPLVRIIDKCPGYGKKVILLATFDPIKELNDKVHSEGTCLTCSSAFNLRGVRVGEKGDYVPFYDHPSANCNAYPYMLQFVPSDLKKIDELSISEDEKKSLKDGPVMKGCFLKKPFWQPADEFENCELYGEEYTPIPLKSDRFKGLLKSMFGYW